MEKALGREINELDKAVRKLCDHEFSLVLPDDLSSQQGRFLGFLARNKEANATDLGEHFNLSKSTVSENLAQMISNGYITSMKSEEDGRGKVLALTEKGIAYRQHAIATIKQIDHRILKGFSEEEVQQLEDFISRIVSNCKEVVK